MFAPLEGKLVELLGLGQFGQCLSWEDDRKEYSVRTFDGAVLSCAASALREYVPSSPEERGGFDVAWPEGEAAETAFPFEVATCLAERGFCLIRTFHASQALDEAREEAQARRDEFEPLPAELGSSWLGEGDPCKVLSLETSADQLGEASGALQGCDARLTEACRVLAPVTPELLGFNSCGRTRAYVRLPNPDIEAEPLSEKDVQDGKIEEFIHFARCRRLSMLQVIDCDDGEVELLPAAGSGHWRARVKVASNMLLLFRHDLFGYALRADGYCLTMQAWVLCEPLEVDFLRYDGPTGRRMEAMGLTGPACPIEGRSCHVAALNERMPGSVYGHESAWAMFMSGGDTGLRWPRTRWEESLYYADDVNAAAYGKTYSVHGAFMDFEETTHFDNEFFGISTEEATWMSVEQRLVLETAFETAQKGGYTRETIRGQRIGVFVGDVGSEELLLPPYTQFSQDGQQGGVVAARLSFAMDLRGPAVSHDTACSSSLMALGFAHWKMTSTNDTLLPAALICGINLHMTPFRYIGLGSGGFLTKKGRCFTFDTTAEGYMRGEGSGSCLLKHSQPGETDCEERSAECIGTALNQDGRSASLTAPNGPSQQAVIKMSMRTAGITADMVGAAECHGTGTSLGDPIELGALMGVLGSGRGSRPLPFTTSKINLGHTEAHAGMAGIAKCVLSCMHTVIAPHNHLVSLSPHLHLEGFPCYIGTDATATGFSSDIIGVSSFGFGGSNGRADFWGRSTNGSGTMNEQIDYLEVVCPRCLGPMCWLCGTAIPQGAPAQRHRCSLVREEHAGYDYCSSCYSGEYRYGEFVQGLANAGHRIFILGTWDAWSTMHEMQKKGDDKYVFTVELGDTRWERFYVALDEDRKLAFYPAANRDGGVARIMGPDEKRGGRNWVVDGRRDGESQGTRYEITFTWGGVLDVSWKVVKRPSPTASSMLQQPQTQPRHHFYYVVGSWTAWNLQMMSPCPHDDNMYEATFRISGRGYEEFQIVRDRDMDQVIHPATAACRDTAVPVRGPDNRGKGKNWFVSGEEFETVRVRLRVEDDGLSLILSSRTLGKRTFRGAAGYAFFVVGSMTAWRSVEMKVANATTGLYRFVACVGRTGVEEFQMVADEDPSQRLYPSFAGAGSGEALLLGPDGGARADSVWRVSGVPGEFFEISLDFSQKDQRRMVQWRFLQATSDDLQAITYGGH